MPAKLGGRMICNVPWPVKANPGGMNRRGGIIVLSSQRFAAHASGGAVASMRIAAYPNVLACNGFQ